MTAPDSEGLQAEAVASERRRIIAALNEGVSLAEKLRLNWAVSYRSVVEIVTEQSPVVPSVGAVPVEVPEDDVIVVVAQAIEQRLRLEPARDAYAGAMGWGVTPRELAELAYPLIAARVRAEGKAERDAELSRWIDVGQRLTEERRLAEAERDEHYRNWQAAEQALTRVRAEERQRAKDEVHDHVDVEWSRYFQLHGDADPVAKAYLAGLTRGGVVAERILAAGSAAPVATPPRPEIVVLCGSTRFKDAFREAAKSEALAGRIVLTVSDLDPRPEMRHVNVPIDAETKAKLDQLHRRKIDLADRVLVLNVGGYIGESTRSEIEYATGSGKPVTYLDLVATPTEPDDGPTHEQIDRIRAEDGLLSLYAEQDGQR